MHGLSPMQGVTGYSSTQLSPELASARLPAPPRVGTSSTAWLRAQVSLHARRPDAGVLALRPDRAAKQSNVGDNAKLMQPACAPQAALPSGAVASTLVHTAAE